MFVYRQWYHNERRRRRARKKRCVIALRPGNTVSKLVFYYPQLMVPQGTRKDSHKYSYRFRYWYVRVRRRRRFFRVFYCLPLFLLRSLYRFFHTFLSLSLSCSYLFLLLPATPKGEGEISCTVKECFIFKAMHKFNAHECDHIANHRQTFSPHNHRRLWKNSTRSWNNAAIFIKKFFNWSWSSSVPLFLRLRCPYLLCTAQEKRNSLLAQRSLSYMKERECSEELWHTIIISY